MCLVNVFACSFFTFGGFCHISSAFSKDLDAHVRDFNKNLIAEKEPHALENQARFEEKLSNIIQFHADAKK